MPIEMIDLPSLATRDMDDLILVYDVSAPSGQSKQMTVGALLADVAIEGEKVSFDTLDATSVTAPEAQFGTIEVATSIEIGGWAKLSSIGFISASVTIPTLAAGVGASVSVTCIGAAAGDFALLNLPASRPDGLIIRADVNAINVLTIRAVNATSTSIAGATYALTAAILRIA